MHPMFGQMSLTSILHVWSHLSMLVIALASKRRCARCKVLSASSLFFLSEANCYENDWHYLEALPMEEFVELRFHGDQLMLKQLMAY